MEYNIYSQSGQVKAVISPTDNSTHENSIMGDNVLNMSFTLFEFVRLTVNDYVMFEGEKYKLLEPYRPTKKSTIEYEYNCKFYGTVGDCKKGIVLKLVDGENKPDFALVDSAAVHLQLVVDNINRIKETLDWTVGEVVDNGNREIVYDSTFCFDALNKIAETFETEWWVEGTTINMSRCEFGTQIELGYNQGLINLARDDNEKARFFTRLLPIGSKRNIDPKVYGHSRLQLPGGAQFVERNTEYGIVEQAEEQAFSHIYPKRIGYVGTVRAVPTKVDGKDRIVYYFNDTGLNFNPNNYNIEGLVKNVVFQSGELNGRDFEVNFNSNTNEFEIILQYPYEDQQLPGGGLIPKTGDEYILYNLRMPTEYYPIAESEFATAVDSFLEKYSIDTSVYKAANDYIYFDENNIDLKVGRRIKLLSEEYFDGGYSNSRVIRIVRKIWNPSIMDIEFSNAVSKGRMESLEHDVDGISVAFKEQLNKEALQVLKSWDSSDPSEYNVLSALRNLKTIKKIALRKDAEDSTDFLVQFLAGLDAERIKLFSSLFSKDYLPGHTGFAFTKDEWGRWLLEVDRIIARESLTVPEFIKNRITVANNQTWFTDNGIIEAVEEVEGDADQRIIIIAQERGGACTFQPDDLLKGIYLDEIDGGLNFQTVRMTVLELITPYRLRVSVDENTPPPRDELIIVRTGNRTNVDRQNSIFIDGARPAMFYYVNVDSHTIGVDNIAQATGNLKGFNFGDLTGNEPIKERFSNVIRGSNYQEGFFVQKSGSGLGYPVPADRGSWLNIPVVDGVRKCYHYDRVSHNGSMWDCAVKETVAEPSESTPDWTKRVAKGIDGIDGKNGQNGADGVNGKDGVSIVFKGEFASHPDNPQNGWGYRNTTDKKSYVYQSGAWYQMTVDGVDGANGKDGLNGVNGKDGKDGLDIVWQGDSPNPPANPQKNWAYRDTDNGVVYIYNGTAWALMVADGSDGEAGAKGNDGNSVFITYHDNPTTSKPAKPTGNGTTGGWHTAPSSSCVWMSQKVALTASVGEWGEPIMIQGEGVGSLEIGGTNLFDNTEKISVVPNGYTPYTNVMADLTKLMKVGEEFVYSFYIYTANRNVDWRIYLSKVPSIVWSDMYEIKQFNTTAGQLIKITGGYTCNADYKYFILYRNDIGVAGEEYISRFMFSRGNKLTDWQLSEADRKKYYVDDVKLGSVNLLNSSEYFAMNGSDTSCTRQVPIYLEAGQEYIISWEESTVPINASGWPRILLWYNNFYNWDGNLLSVLFSQNKVVFRPIATGNYIFDVYANAQTAGLAGTYLKKVKIAKGNKYDAWTPSLLEQQKSRLYQGVFIAGRAYQNNVYRQDMVKYGSAWYKYVGIDGQAQGSWNSANWKPFGASFESVATGMLFAENASIQNGQANELQIQDSTGSVVGGISGNGTSGSDIRQWFGGTKTQAEALVAGQSSPVKTAITRDGRLYTVAAVLSGALRLPYQAYDVYNGYTLNLTDNFNWHLNTSYQNDINVYLPGGDKYNGTICSLFAGPSSRMGGIINVRDEYGAIITVLNSIPGEGALLIRTMSGWWRQIIKF